MSVQMIKKFAVGALVAAVTVASVASAEARPRYYRGGGNGGAAFAAMAIGMIGITAAIAAANSRPTYYAPHGYYQPEPVYEDGYGYYPHASAVPQVPHRWERHNDWRFQRQIGY